MIFVYFDDEPRQRELLAGRLQGNGLEVVSMPPPADLQLSGLPQHVDGFLVDYQLTQPEPGRAGARYKGGTLGSAIREQYPTSPLVLVTRKSLVNERSEDDLLEELGVFDVVRFKGQVERYSAAGRRELIALAEGFQSLGAAEKSWDGVLDVLLPPHDEDVLALREAPPTLTERQWDLVPIARWLLRIVLRYPGIVVDDAHAAATLGLDPDAMRIPDLEQFLAPARYAGPFADVDRRWWHQSLVRTAQAIADDGSRGPLYLRFSDQFRNARGLDLPRAACVDCGEPAGSRCFVLDRPVRHDHSLPYFPDQRPAIMEVARVSFQAIRHTNDVVDERVDPTASPILASLRQAAR